MLWLILWHQRIKTGRLGLVFESKAERLNTVTALFGAIAAVCGIAWLISIAIFTGDLWKVITFSIYGGALILTFVFATLYHSSSGNAKAVFSKLDHVSIYLLIAGTYTPFALVTLRDSVGWPLFAVTWGMALLGIILDLMPKQGNRVLPVIIYLTMGWLMVVAINPLLQVLPWQVFTACCVGGIFYTVGVFFYLHDGKVSYFHGIWHILVLLGSFSHYLTILNFVA
ncbi:MAG: hemolysin III family protein [Methylomicrobium sp.]|nr:hemolysin III family protein [Methylomicrobium sp.]